MGSHWESGKVWSKRSMQTEIIEVGQILDGTVTKIMPYGAFVALPGGKNGMIHISQAANGYVKDIHDVLSEKQAVRVKVLSIENGKIALTLRFTEEKKPSFEDMMASFMKTSGEKISEMGTKNETRRRSGGGGNRRR